VAALHVRDEDKLRDLLEDKLRLERAGEEHGADLYREKGAPEASIALENGTVVAASDERALVAALARRDGDGHLTPERFDAALRDLPQGALARAYGDLGALLRQPGIAPLRKLKWVDRLRSFGATVSFRGSEIVLDASLNTDSAGLGDADLPFVPGAPAPALPQRPDEINSASANQSQTTVFLLRALRAARPGGRFARDVAIVERERGIDFEREFLQQFDGPSASVLKLDGQFAARSTVRDPKRMATTLRKIAPDLGRLARDLDPLRGPGLAALLLFTPDAPVGTSVLGRSRVRVELLRGEGQLYRISRLNSRPPAPSVGGPPPPPVPGQGPDEIYFGLVDNVFVVGSSEERARAMARERVAPSPGLAGASVTRVELATLGGLEDRLGFELQPQDEFVGSVRVSPERLRVTGRIRLP
jgi:hypothetical protein